MSRILPAPTPAGTLAVAPAALARGGFRPIAFDQDDLLQPELVIPSGVGAKVFVFTGNSRIGKSTLLSKLAVNLGAFCRVGGILTRVISDKRGRRRGLDVQAIALECIDEFVRKDDSGAGYHLCDATVKDLVTAELRQGIYGADVLLIDEIGDLQLRHPKFLSLVEEALANSQLWIIAAAGNECVAKLREIAFGREVHAINITADNRDALTSVVAARVTSEISSRQRAPSATQ